MELAKKAWMSCCEELQNGLGISLRKGNARSSIGAVPPALATRTSAGWVKNVAVWTYADPAPARQNTSPAAPPASGWQVRPSEVAIDWRTSPDGPLVAPGIGDGMPSAATGAAASSQPTRSTTIAPQRRPR